MAERQEGSVNIKEMQMLKEYCLLSFFITSFGYAILSTIVYFLSLTNLK